MRSGARPRAAPIAALIVMVSLVGAGPGSGQISLRTEILPVDSVTLSEKDFLSTRAS